MTQRLPPDVLTHIFEYLSFANILKCSLVSNEWYVAANDDFLWIEFATRNGVPKQKNKPYRASLIRHKQRTTARKNFETRFRIVFEKCFQAQVACIIANVAIWTITFQIWLFVFIFVAHSGNTATVTSVKVTCTFYNLQIVTNNCYNTICQTTCVQCIGNTTCDSIPYANQTTDCCGDPCCNYTCVASNGTIVPSCKDLLGCSCTCPDVLKACTLHPAQCYDIQTMCYYIVPYNGENRTSTTTAKTFPSYQEALDTVGNYTLGSISYLLVNLPKDKYYRAPMSVEAIVATVLTSIMAAIPTSFIICLAICLPISRCIDKRYIGEKL